MADNLTQLTSDIVSSYVAENKISLTDLATFIDSVHAALGGLGQPEVTPEPAVQKATAAQIRKSITPDALISFIDGRGYKTIKRHLNGHNHTVQSYREAFGLPNDYPTTAPNYSKARSEMAKSRGLGRVSRAAAVEPPPTPSKAAPKLRTKKAAAAPPE